MSRLRVEDDFQSKFGEARFNVARGSCRIAGVGIPPVPLHIQKQVFLTQLYHGITDRGIPMRVILHGIPDYIGYFVIAAVLQFPERVQYAALYRLETIVCVGDSPFQNDIAGVFKKPATKH